MVPCNDCKVGEERRGSTRERQNQRGMKMKKNKNKKRELDFVIFREQHTINKL
jgi:hypothetical protein